MDEIGVIGERLFAAVDAVFAASPVPLTDTVQGALKKLVPACGVIEPGLRVEHGADPRGAQRSAPHQVLSVTLAEDL